VAINVQCVTHTRLMCYCVCLKDIVQWCCNLRQCRSTDRPCHSLMPLQLYLFQLPLFSLPSYLAPACRPVHPAAGHSTNTVCANIPTGTYTGPLYLRTPCSRVFLEKLTGSQLVKKFPHFTKPQGSLPHTQVPATCPYPEPDQSSPCPHIPLLIDPS
jgi:hypothetical protein